jgi:hypothetical protein
MHGRFTEATHREGEDWFQVVGQSLKIDFKSENMRYKFSSVGELRKDD